MDMYRVVFWDILPRFKAIAFSRSYLWNIENPILEIQVQEHGGEFEAWFNIKWNYNWIGFVISIFETGELQQAM